MKAFQRVFLLAGIVLLAHAAAAQAQDRLCDPGNENCRNILINYIRNEQVGIDVAFWFMEDPRYATELIRRHRAGVPIRVLMDTRANTDYPDNAKRLAELSSAGIPMRRRTSSYILHWKMMLFHGQNVVEFSGANYSPEAWLPLTATPYENYIDEAIYFTSDTAIVDTFRTAFDDQWVNETNWTNYANITGPLVRRYDVLPKDPSMNFPPAESYRSRSLAAYKAETYWIDAIMYRITDRRQTDAILEAVRRGVTVRLITEPQQYRDPRRLWHSWNVDRLYMGGVQLKHRAHAGLNHQKSVILYGQQTVIFGSSNWTSASADGQLEHNMFTNKPYVYTWFWDQFTRKWNNLGGVAETKPFVPLPPDAPKAPSPANGAIGVTRGVTLRWHGGPWAHLYDVYLGTSPASLALIASNLELGPSESSTEVQSYVIPGGLAGNTTYYWKVVGKTMALQARSSPVWHFTTTESATPPAATLVSPIGTSSPANQRFVWNAVGNATHYYLWISDTTGKRFDRWYRSDEVHCPDATGTCWMAPVVSLTPGRIWWWIQTWNLEGGYGPWSKAGTYTLRPMGAPTLVAPSGTVAGGPAIRFRWNPAKGATHHYVWVTDGAGIVRVRQWYTVDQTGCADGSECGITLQPTLSPGTATWWVQAWAVNAGYGPWSAPLRFTAP